MNILKQLYKIYKEACYKYCGNGTIFWEPSTIILVILLTMSTVASFLLANKGIKGPDEYFSPEEGGKVNTRSTQTPLPIVYGRRRVASNDVYGFTGGNENKDLYIVMTLSEGECDSIYQSSGVDQVWLGDKLYNEYEGNATYTFHSGSSTQTYDTTLHGVENNWIDNMRNTCYIVMKLHWDRDLFRGIPQRQVELKGVKCYNFITDVTEWTDNPVLCLYDFFTNQRYGIGLNASQIDTDSWTTAKNYCAHKNFKLNMLISRNDNSWEIIESILIHFRGTINYWDGKYYLNYADTLDSTYKELSVMTIEDGHINVDATGKAQISINQPGRFNNPEGLRVSFIDAEKKYTTDNIIVGDPIGMISDFKLEGCIDREMAGILGVSQLERLQLDRTISGVFRDECIELEPNDIITFNSSAIGIEDQKMRVVSSSIQQSGLIGLTLRYESDAIYNDVYDIELEEEYVCSLPDPNSTPPNLENITVTEETYYYDLKTFSKLNITFTEPTNYAWYDGFEVWMAITDSASPPSLGDYVHQFNSSAQFSIDPVAENKHYWLKLRTINTWGVKRPLNLTITKYSKVIGKSTTQPPSLTSLVAVPSDMGVNLYATKLSDPDIESYEFRFGSQWNGGIFLADTRSPNYSIISVSPGTVQFTVNSKGTNGLYGAYPQTSNQVVINRPKYWTTEAESFDCDYTTGTHDGTEHFIYNANDYLRATHAGGGGTETTGTYTSPKYTATSSDTYYIYMALIDEIVVSGDSTTWSGVSPTVSTWGDIGADTKTWNGIWQTNEAPKVYMSLQYSVDDSTWYEAKKMELCAVVVTAKYFKIEIVIEDPAIDVKAYIPEFSLKLYT